MVSSAAGAADLIVLRIFSRTERTGGGNFLRYSSTVLKVEFLVFVARVKQEVKVKNKGKD